MSASRPWRDKKYVLALTFDPAEVYPAWRRRFRQAADSRGSAPWPAVAGIFGLNASEGQLHCPVSRPVPVKNQAFFSIPPQRAFFIAPINSPQRARLRQSV